MLTPSDCLDLAERATTQGDLAAAARFLALAGNVMNACDRVQVGEPVEIGEPIILPDRRAVRSR